MSKQVFHFFSSLRLTVALLFFSILLVFFGTLDQVHIGIYLAQKEYFESFFVIWTYPEQFYGYEQLRWLSIPLPGGYLLGGLLVINLLCAHFRYFKFQWSRLGIAITHFGVVLLLISGFMISGMQRESLMSIQEGQTANYSQSFYYHEIALIDTSDAETDIVTVIPEGMFKEGKVYSSENLPFQVKLHRFYPHVNFGRKAQNPSYPLSGATMGIGKEQELVVFPEEPSYAQTSVNYATALVEVLDGENSLGKWLISIIFDMNFPPQSFEFGGKTYQITLRPERYYKPYEMYLEEVTHDVYPGTTISKNFASKVDIRHQDDSYSRDALIYMNHPLRYEGLTYYQFQMIEEEGITRFQVVRNPSWLIPYIAVGLVGIGMCLQFTQSLLKFKNRSRRKAV